MLAGFRTLVDAAMEELARRGHPDFRPVHEYALMAIEAGAVSASDLGRSLSVSKQAAAKTIATLERRGYLSVETDPEDARRKKLEVTAKGKDVMRQGAAIFDELRAEWANRIGERRLDEMEADLEALVGASPLRFDTPGWMTQDK
jgi:DNA-binding MarR family transcriptional regulator